MVFIDELREVIMMSGWIAIPLVASSGLLWYAIVQRCAFLRRYTKSPLRHILHQAREGGRDLDGLLGQAASSAIAQARSFKGTRLRKNLSAELKFFESEATRYRAVITSLVMIAPLLGLLGTVMGMIETFEGLGAMTLYSQSGGIAGGISKALITTQIGLLIAIPGLLFERFLSDWEERRVAEVQQLHEIVLQTNT